jgi:hypothetical protein
MRCPEGKTIILFWHTDLTAIEPYLNWSTAQFIDDGKRRRYIFPLGDRTSWKYASKVSKVVITNFPLRYKIFSVRLKDESSLVPTLRAISTPTVVNHDIQADGFYPVNNRQGLEIFWDAAKVSGAVSTILQISLPDFMYAQFADGFREFELEKHSLKTIDTASLCRQATLTRKDFPLPGKYQVRVAARDKEGKVIGYCSDPLDIMVTDEPLESEFDKAIFNLRAQRQR